MEKYELGFEHDSLNTMVIFVDLVLKLIYDIKCLSKQKKIIIIFIIHSRTNEQFFMRP